MLKDGPGLTAESRQVDEGINKPSKPLSPPRTAPQVRCEMRSETDGGTGVRVTPEQRSQPVKE